MESENQSLLAGALGVDADKDAWRSFWLTHIRIGFGVFLGETLVVLGYLALTPHGPHRKILWFVAVLWLVLALVGMSLAPLVASRPWCATYSVTWTALSAFGVAGIAILDLGMNSPLLVLLFLPLIFGTLMFTPRAAAVCGLAALASVALVALTDSHIASAPGQTFLLFAALAGASALTVAASINRTHIEQHGAELQTALAEMAAIDELTGCVVRRVLWQRMNEEIARSIRNRSPLSLLMIDVDQFKAVNDTYGHVVGDHVLAAIGSVLRKIGRSFDVVARLGGDEFAVLLPETGMNGAVEVADRIRADLPRAVEVPVTLSIGIGGLDGSTPTAEHMLDDADFALYQVKRGGRDAIAVRAPHSMPTPT
ncbi:MAG TPA: GGDEF domain-containing protein [Acidimicrobiales bacterium]|nr:GGDEF domain-containing protein [Acidimicrobiales bacterium]